VRRRAGIAAATAALALAAAPAARAAEQQAYAAAFTYPTAVVLVAPGDTLRFNNIDIAGHDLRSVTPGQFSTPVIGGGQSALVDGVDKLAPGTYPFVCSVHPWMRGAIEVAAGAPTPPPPPNPSDPPNPLDLMPHAKPAPLTGGDWHFYGHDLANSRSGGQFGPSYNELTALRPVWSVKSPLVDLTLHTGRSAVSSLYDGPNSPPLRELARSWP